MRAGGHEVTVVNLHSEKADKATLAESEFLVLGGPTRMKHMGRRALKFAKKLDAASWAGKPALVYDTYGPLDPDPAKNEGDAWAVPGRQSPSCARSSPSAASYPPPTTSAASSPG